MMRNLSLTVLAVVFFWSCGWVCTASANGEDVDESSAERVRLTTTSGNTIAVGDSDEPESLFEDGSDGTADADASPEEEKWPFLFMLTIALVALYVGYRIIQMIVQLIQWMA